MKEFDSLIEIMNQLRDNCPWDREQNLSTLRKYLIEESYECLEAMEDYLEAASPETYTHLREELGDVLLQILFQSRILSELNGGDPLVQLMTELQEKLIRRHPHIFGDSKDTTQSAEAVYQRWNEIKAAEKGSKDASKGILDGISKHSSAMMQSAEIGKRCQKVGFDWNSPEEVWNQVEREIVELKGAKTRQEQEDEWADLVFSMIQYARHLKIDPEVALFKMNRRFKKRFEHMEKSAATRGQSFESLARDEKEKLWQEAKLGSGPHSALPDPIPTES